MSTLELHPDNSVTVQIILSNALLDEYVNDATVTCKIKNDTGDEIKSSFSLPYISSSEGIYRVTLAPVTGLVLDNIYTVIIDAVGADSLIGHWETRIRAELAPY
ncbi:MAG: hypothetical protein GY928_00565 [Colwellia sp.]|nr:hypothetical protein [Colwellia sp.]